MRGTVMANPKGLDEEALRAELARMNREVFELGAALHEARHSLAEILEQVAQLIAARMTEDQTTTIAVVDGIIERYMHVPSPHGADKAH